MNLGNVCDSDDELTHTQECVQSSQEITMVPGSPDQHALAAVMLRRGGSHRLPHAPRRHSQEGANAYGPSMPRHSMTVPSESLPMEDESLATWLEEDHEEALSQFLGYTSQGVHAQTCVHLRLKTLRDSHFSTTTKLVSSVWISLCTHRLHVLR